MKRDRGVLPGAGAAGPASGILLPLESLRGIAALCVALAHTSWNGTLSDNALTEHASLFVDFFFVLSGFVIHRSYAHRLTARRQAVDFMVLRLGRLYPLHLVMLLAFLGYEAARFLGTHHFGLLLSPEPFEQNSPGAFVQHLTLVHALEPNAPLTFNTPSWSISVEMSAYLLFAIIWTAAAARPFLKWSLAALAILVSITMLLDEGNGLQSGLWLCRGLVGFFIGVLTSRLFHSMGGWHISRVGWTTLEGVSIIAALIFLTGILKENMQLLVLPVFAGVVLVFAGSRGVLAHVLSRPVFVFLGTISYSIYMTHMLIEQVFAVGLVRGFGFKQTTAGIVMPSLTGDVVTCLFMAAVVGASYLSYRAVEAPWRQKTRQWIAGPRSVSRASAPAIS